MPTDTVCGLFVLPSFPESVDRVFEIKKRDKNKPLVLLLSSIEDIWEYAEYSKELEEKCEKYWPGAVTLIINRKGGGTIGLRVPDYQPVRDLIRKTGPLYATSANSSGNDTPGKISEVEDEIKEKCDFIADFDYPQSNIPSKIINLAGQSEEVIRG